MVPCGICIAASTVGRNKHIRGHWPPFQPQLPGEPRSRPYEGMAKGRLVGPSLSFSGPVADIVNQSPHSLPLSQNGVSAPQPGLAGGYNISELQGT